MERHNSGPERKLLSTRLVYPAKLSFLIEGKIKTFHNKETKGICDHQAHAKGTT
jgi:hypothetical protein